MHRNAPLTEEGRRRLCERIASGWTVAAAAESMNISRQCAHKWWRRFRDEGEAGLRDRSSRPHSCPHQRRPASSVASWHCVSHESLAPIASPASSICLRRRSTGCLSAMG